MLRSVRTLAAVVAAALSVGCGGSSHHDSPPAARSPHPTLDQDYAPAFAGTWSGTFSMTINGRTQTDASSQPILRTGVNLLGLVELCPNADGVAGLDSPTTFSTDPITCPGAAQPCGNLVLGWESVTGTLAGGTLSVAMRGTASCAGTKIPFTASFTGTLGAAGTPGLATPLDAPAEGLAAALVGELTAQAAAAATAE